MKNLIMVVAVIFLTVTSCISQDVPQAVTKAFELKYPGATSVKWDKENAHEYEAEFELAGLKYSTNFSDTGEWMETESSVTFNQLPEKVQQTFNTSHKDAKVKAVAKIETSKGITNYEVEIKKCLGTKEFLYTAEGVEIKE